MAYDEPLTPSLSTLLLTLLLQHKGASRRCEGGSRVASVARQAVPSARVSSESEGRAEGVGMATSRGGLCVLRWPTGNDGGR